MDTVTNLIFLRSKITADGGCKHEKRCLLLGTKAMTNLHSILKSRDITLSTKVCRVKAMFFSSSCVWMWELDHKEGWAPKIWCFWSVVLEKTLESPLDCKEIKSVNPKGDQSWIFKDWWWSWSSNILATWCKEPNHWKSPWCWKRQKQEEKGTTEDQMVGRHHRLHGHEIELALGDGEGQGSLVCCGPWSLKEKDVTEWLNSSLFPVRAITEVLYAGSGWGWVKIQSPGGRGED